MEYGSTNYLVMKEMFRRKIIGIESDGNMTALLLGIFASKHTRNMLLS